MGEAEEEELEPEGSCDSCLLLLRLTESAVGASISTMASLRLSAPPSVGTLGRRECRAVTPCADWGSFSDKGSAWARTGVGSWDGDSESDTDAFADAFDAYSFGEKDDSEE